MMQKQDQVLIFLTNSLMITARNLYQQSQDMTTDQDRRKMALYMHYGVISSLRDCSYYRSLSNV
jgi:hypothetical protein